MTGIGEIDYEFDVIFLPKKGDALSTFAGLVDHHQSTTVYQPVSTSSPITGSLIPMWPLTRVASVYC